jgi:hypothetical protein
MEKTLTDKKFKHLLGKRCSVLGPTGEIVGILQFAGHNDILNVNQVTLSRMPVFPVDLNSLKLFTKQ